MADGIDEESADDDYYKTEDASRKGYEVAVNMTTERPMRVLKENNKLGHEEWSDAESLYHNALAQAERDSQNAASIAVKACRRGDMRSPRAQERTDAMKLNNSTSKAIGWAENERAG